MFFCKITIAINLLKCFIKLPGSLQDSNIFDSQTKKGALQSKIDALKAKIYTSEPKFSLLSKRLYII